MKNLFATVAALMCLTMDCGAATDQNSILTEIQSRYAWLPQNDEPIVKMREATYYRFNVTYPKSRVMLQLDDNATLVSANWNEGGTPDERGDYASHVNEEFIWGLRPDLPKDKMVRVFEGYYCYQRPDGVIDPGVMMTMYRSSGTITGFIACNKPNDGPLPLANITETDARNICNGVDTNFVCDNGKGVTTSWPYYHEQHPEWAQASIRPDDMNGSYIAYDFTYRLGEEPDLVFDEANEEKTHTLPILNNRVNATTGDIVYVKRDFYKASSASRGVKTNKPVSRYPAVPVKFNTTEANLGFPVILDRKLTYVPLNTIEALAKGHTVTAKADAKAFKLDGKELALPAKVLSRKGVLYLPWQSLNSLPGVKAQYDAKLAKLDITTASVTAAK